MDRHDVITLAACLVAFGLGYMMRDARDLPDPRHLPAITAPSRQQELPA